MQRLITGFILCVFVVLGIRPAAAEDLSVLARVGPWPVAENLIVYRGRVWFSTSVKGVDHNSADIWSFGPADRDLKFERYLFSQSVGKPAVHDGLLYWPHEDMRVGSSNGMVAVTNGGDWAELVLPVGETMMHTHAVAKWNNGLVAAMAGWNSALVLTNDGGTTWQTLSLDPPRTGTFHRYNDVAAAGGRLFVRHFENTGYSLAEWRDGKLVEVDGWPQGQRFSHLASFREALYAIVRGPQGDTLWRVGAGRPERIDTGITQSNWLVLTSGGDRLWLVSRTDNGGQVWSSADGRDFKPRGSVSGGVPHDAAVLGSQIFIGGAGDDGMAVLWGPDRVAVRVGGENSAPSLPALGKPDMAGQLTDELRDSLVSALADPDMLRRHGRPLRALIDQALAAGTPPDFFSGLLAMPVADVDLPLFGGQFTAPAREVAHWHLMAAMARAGERSVPVDILRREWKREPNRPQKWFDPLLVGLYAVQQTGQADRPTVDALVGRLDRPGDPDWLQSQITGTLSAVTGQSLAYDHDAWRRWWQAEKDDWTGTDVTRQ